MPTLHPPHELRIGALGMVTPVGLSAASTCAALRAGISRLQELPVVTPLPEPVMGAWVPTVDALNFYRLLRLLVPALQQTIAHIDAEDLEQVPLIVGTAEPGRPDRPPRLDGQLLSEISQRLGVTFSRRYSGVIAEGRTSVFRGLAIARELIGRGLAPRCIVAGVDSMVNQDAIGWLYRNERLKMPDDPDGVMPGEGAAAVELLPLAGAGAADTVDVLVRGLGFGVERATVVSDEPSLAEGLTAAVRAALEEAGMRLGEMDFRVSDLTGEQYYFRETNLAESRLLREHKEGFPIWHCAEGIADVGAAVGGVMLGQAATALRRGYAPGRSVLCQSSSDGGTRAAVVITAAAENAAGVEPWPRR
jgi:3-oxoacyl-[acyl-carrier-protein] synthase-1